MKLRLFVLRHGVKGPMVRGEDGTPLYFSNKVDAKRHRDSIDSKAVVSYGPDHKRFKGE